MKIVLNVILAKEKGMGGFNVAVNFYNQTLRDQENEWFYFVSKEFDEKVKGMENGLDANHYFIFHSQPNLKHYFSDKRLIRQIETDVEPDVIYSILAPSYHRFKTVEVMRCANAWAVVGGVNKYALSVTPLKYRVRYLVKAWITRFLMRNTKYFVTQSEIAKNCILNTVNTSTENVCVVSNVLSEKFQRTNVEKFTHEGFNMVYVSSPSVHKDYMLLPQVASILISKYGMKDFKMHVTVPDYCSSNFMKCLDDYHVQDYFVNHGFLGLEELIQNYLQCDMGLFPSLLETFSATLLEYMYFRLPIVASDLDFNKEVTGDAAIYFEPHNAEDFAQKIYQVYSNDSLRHILLDKAKKRLSYYKNNADKFSETVRFLREVALQTR